MKYKHVIFDIDGTLTETEYAVLKSLQDVIMARLGKAYTLEELRFVKGIPGWKAFEQIGFAEADYAQVMREWEDGMRALNDTIYVYEGAEQLIETLEKEGVGLGIATSKTRSQYDVDFCRFEVAKHFEISITCEDTDAPKPAAGPLMEYMKRTGAKPEEMLYVGDAVYDSMTAAAAGVDFALACWGATEDIAAKYYPKTPLELLKMIC